MPESDSIAELIKRLEAGDEDAANEIWQNCYPRLIEYARKKLIGVSRKMADEDDVVVSAFESFFKATRNKRFPKLNDRDDLWRVLFALTNWKAINLRRYEQRRPVNGETVMQHPGDSTGGLHNIPGNESEEAFAAIIVELLEDKLGALNSELCQLAIDKLEGFNNPEIAELRSISSTTVNRKLHIIRQIWKEHGNDTSA